MHIGSAPVVLRHYDSITPPRTVQSKDGSLFISANCQSYLKFHRKITPQDYLLNVSPRDQAEVLTRTDTHAHPHTHTRQNTDTHADRVRRGSKK